MGIVQKFYIFISISENKQCAKDNRVEMDHEQILIFAILEMPIHVILMRLVDVEIYVLIY